MKYAIIEDKAINLDLVEMVEIEGGTIAFRFSWGGVRHIPFEILRRRSPRS